MGDRKNFAILILILIILALGIYIGVSKYNQKQLTIKQAIYEQGVKDGQLVEQRNAILQLQSSGFYGINYIDENNETQTIKLTLLPQDLAQQNSGK